MSINKVILIANLGKDPEIRSMQNGEEVATFSVATSERWTDKQGQKQEKSEWHKVVVFGGLVKIVKAYLKKGSKVYLEGKLTTRKWQDQSGADRYTTEIVLQGFNANLQLLDMKPQDGNTAHNEAKANGYQAQPVEEDGVPDFDSEVPF